MPAPADLEPEEYTAQRGLAAGRLTYGDWTGEALKVLRAGWVTAPEFADAMGTVFIQGARAQLNQLEAQGLVVSRKRADTTCLVTPTEYTLAPAWRGQP